MQIHLELSFNSSALRNSRLMNELRDYYQGELPEFEFSFKELPTRPGLMSSSEIAGSVLEAVTLASVETVVHLSLEYWAERIMEAKEKLERKNNRDFGKMNITGYIKKGNSRKTFSIDNKNKISYYKYSDYSIDKNRTYVLLVGCGKFKTQTIKDIPQVEKNIQELYNLFVSPLHIGIPEDNIVFLLNETCLEIKEHLHDLSNAKDIETFIFYYAGHGFYSGKDNYYLASYDTSRSRGFVNSGIEKKFLLKDILEKSPAKQKIAIIDACYSGILAQGEYRPTYTDEVKGSYILTSSNADNVSKYDENDSYTFFTGSLINILSNGILNGAQIITLDDLYTVSCEKMREKELNEPIFKSKLNIPPSNFVVSRNVAFSVEDEIDKINKLLDTVSEETFDIYETANTKYLKLLSSFPSHTGLLSAYALFNNRWECLISIRKGDKYYSKRKFHLARKHYEQALELNRNDFIIKDKIQKCIQESQKKSILRILLKVLIPVICVFIAYMIWDIITATAFSNHAAVSSQNSDSVKRQDLPKDTTSYSSIGSDSSLRDGVLRKADSFFHKKKYSSAVILYGRDTNVLSTERRYRLAMCYFYVNDFEEAKPLFEDLAEHGQYQEGAMKQLGFMYATGTKTFKQNLALAKGYFEKALNQNPEYSFAMSGLGKVYEDQGNFTEAIKWYKKALHFGDQGAAKKIIKIYKNDWPYDGEVKAFYKWACVHNIPDACELLEKESRRMKKKTLN